MECNIALFIQGVMVTANIAGALANVCGEALTVEFSKNKSYNMVSKLQEKLNPDDDPSHNCSSDFYLIKH